MKALLVIFLILPGYLIAEPSREEPSPDRLTTAYLSAMKNRKTGGEGTRVMLKDVKGATIVDDTETLSHYSMNDVVWTEDGKYLLLATINADGHSPWHHPVFILRLATHQIRRIDDFENNPFIGDQVWTRAPDTVILVAHTFSHGRTAPDDPVIVSFRVSEVWAKLKP